jgi:ABC-type transport system involved in multi-copper enzyme maturation permease subunit
MLKLIIEKELRETIGSTKFAVSFAICSILIILAFAIGASGYHTNVSRYEASRRENMKQFEGLTDWLMVRQNRVFLPPSPLAVLVAGVSNDIGRTTEIRGRGELQQDDTRYNEEPVFAVFRFLDLEFIFQIVLSLFAILFAYDAINGEKERGTLRLSFANPLPRRVYVLGKLLGSFFALVVPLMIPILIGVLLLPVLGVPMSGDDWVRLALVLLAGILYVGTFLTVSLAISALTQRSSTSFLMLLVIWVFAVLIIPRSAILVAGRAVDIPSVDEIGAQKARLNQQLWTEDRVKMAGYKPAVGNPESALQDFQKFMSSVNDEREKKMNELSLRLAEERSNKQAVQQRLAFAIARISPSALFSLAASGIAGTALTLKEHYLKEARAYQQTYAKFITDKTGMNPGGGMVFRIVNDGTPPKPIDPNELPPFVYHPQTAADLLPDALLDLGLLALFNMVFFSIAHAAFAKYDLR